MLVGGGFKFFRDGTKNARQAFLVLEIGKSLGDGLFHACFLVTGREGLCCWGCWRAKAFIVACKCIDRSFWDKVHYYHLVGL